MGGTASSECYRSQVDFWPPGDTLPDQLGDQEGRRLHRWRAQRLSEAGRIAGLLDRLLRRAQLHYADLDQLVRRIGQAEQAELEAAHGRVESRKRFGGATAQPLLSRRTRNFLFVDESGSSRPNVDGKDDFLALAGIGIHPNAAAAWAVKSAEIKRTFNLPPWAVFHEPDMRSRTVMWGFGADAHRQTDFDRALLDALEATPFTVFGAGIRKQAFGRLRVESGDPYLPVDVYSMAIELLLERYIDFVAMSAEPRPMGRLKFESQGALEDAHHAREYVHVLIEGTQWIAGGAFRQLLETSPRFIPKEEGVGEIADMLARDMQEWMRAGCTGWPGRWRLFFRAHLLSRRSPDGQVRHQGVAGRRHPRRNRPAPRRIGPSRVKQIAPPCGRAIRRHRSPVSNSAMMIRAWACVKSASQASCDRKTYCHPIRGLDCALLVPWVTGPRSYTPIATATAGHVRSVSPSRRRR